MIKCEAPADSRIKAKPIRDLNFPDDAIDVSFMHGCKVVMPDGERRVRPGNREVVFTPSEARMGVKKSFL